MGRARGRPGRRKKRHARGRIAEFEHADTPRGVTWFGRAATGVFGMAPLLCLVVVPLYFNPRTDRVFEPDKLAWVTALGAVALAGLSIVGVERPRRALELLHNRVVQLGLLAVGVLGAATWGSISPIVSLWGGYRRGQGWWVEAAFWVLLVAVAASAGSPAYRERFQRAWLLPVAPAGLYALFQRAGIDIIPWSQYGAQAAERAFASLGNAIFLGGWLMLAVPLLCVRIAALWTHRDPERRTARWIGLATHWTLLALALGGLWASDSRGPVVGLVAAMVALGAMWLADRGHFRRALWTVAGAPLLLAALVGLGRLGIPGLERWSALADGVGRTLRQRMLAWDALARSVPAEPVRAVFGYGPETTPHLLPAYASAELRRLTPEQIFDRAHNMAWEWWVNAGAVGVAVHVVLIISVFVLGLGLIRGSREETQADEERPEGAPPGASTLPPAWRPVIVRWGIPAMGATLGGATGAILRPGLAGPGVLGGLWLGLLVAAIWTLGGASSRVRASVSDRRASATGTWFAGSRSALVMAVLAAWAGHLVEAAVGLPFAAGRTTVWLAAGLLVGLAISVGEDDRGSAEGGPESGGRGSPPAAPLAATPTDPIQDGLLEGTAVSTLLYAPLLIPFGWAGLWSGNGYWLLALPLTAWWVADGLAAPGDAALGSSRRTRRTRWARWAARLTVPGMFAVLLIALRTVTGGAIYAFALGLGIVLLASAVQWLRSGPSAPPVSGESWRYVPYVGMMLLALVGAWRLALRPVVADAHLRQGLEATARQAPTDALRSFERARSIWPEQPVYAGYLAGWHRARLVSADAGIEDRQAAFESAVAQLTVAEAMAPTSSTALRLGTLSMDLGDVAADEDSRSAAWEQAAGWLQRSLQRDPHSIDALIALSALRERQGMLPGAERLLERAVDLDPGRLVAWASLARIRLARGDADGAARAVRRVLDNFAAEEVAAVLRSPVDAPWAEGLGPPVDPDARDGSLILLTVLVDGEEAGREALTLLTERSPNATTTGALVRWMADRQGSG